MTFLGSCNYMYDDGRRCSKTYNLHNFFFRDPNSLTSSIFIDLCKWHTDEICGNIVARTKDFQMKLTNLIAESARLRRIARENDTYYNNMMIQQKIEDLRELIKKVQNNECKNFFCNANLKNIHDKLYSVHVFKPGGRRWYTFYYCSLRCYNNMKAKCGLPIALTSGQTVLNY